MFFYKQWRTPLKHKYKCKSRYKQPIIYCTNRLDITWTQCIYVALDKLMEARGSRWWDRQSSQILHNVTLSIWWTGILTSWVWVCLGTRDLYSALVHLQICKRPVSQSQGVQASLLSASLLGSLASKHFRVLATCLSCRANQQRSRMASPDYAIKLLKLFGLSQNACFTRFYIRSPQGLTRDIVSWLLNQRKLQLQFAQSDQSSKLAKSDVDVWGMQLNPDSMLDLRVTGNISYHVKIDDKCCRSWKEEVWTT